MYFCKLNIVFILDIQRYISRRRLRHKSIRTGCIFDVHYFIPRDVCNFNYFEGFQKLSFLSLQGNHDVIIN